MIRVMAFLRVLSSTLHQHPAWPAGYGAWYTAGVLNALTSDPDVWARTALLITFDENDGFFDHVPPPAPPSWDAARHELGASNVNPVDEYHAPRGADPADRPDLLLRPYGLFAVISPFNFPLALAAGMSSAALLGGNAVILKPSEETPASAEALYFTLRDAGLPEGLFQLLHGSGEVAHARSPCSCTGVESSGSRG